MGRNDDPPQDDADSTLFRASVKGTRRLVDDRVHHRAPRRTAPPRHAAEHDGITETSRPAEGHGVQARTLQRLRRGRIPPQAALDLHGMTRAEARHAVNRFLDASARAGRRCVLIVHGVGRGSEYGLGVLRSALPEWLEAHPDVLASSPARPPDGGAGASYVLLSRAARRDGPVR